MANIQMGSVNTLVANARKAVPGIDSTSGFTTPVNYSSISAMRTRLAAADGTYYTSAELDRMTVNDMVWALRSIDDATTIKQ